MVELKHYRKKPVVIEAMEVTRDGAFTVGEWCNGRVIYTPPGKISGVDIATLEGLMHASIGDFVIRGVHGEFYPCKPDIFAATYEELTGNA